MRWRRLWRGAQHHAWPPALFTPCTLPAALLPDPLTPPPPPPGRSFLDASPAELAAFSINCPYTNPNAAVRPDALTLAAAFLEGVLRGEEGVAAALADWASAPAVAARLAFGVKGGGAGGGAVASQSGASE